MHFSLNNWELLEKGCARLFLIKCQISGKEMPVLASRNASSCIKKCQFSKIMGYTAILQEFCPIVYLYDSK